MHHESTPGITQELGDDARQKKRNYKGSVVNVNQIITISVVFECALDKNTVSVRKIRTACQK